MYLSATSKNELESLKYEFIKGNLAGKSKDNLLKIFAIKSLRFLVVSN